MLDVFNAPKLAKSGEATWVPGEAMGGRVHPHLALGAGGAPLDHAGGYGIYFIRTPSSLAAELHSG